MTSTDVRERARQAHRFLEAATDSVALHPDHANVAVSNAVLAGIAAGDAICGRMLGECASGESHNDAVRLLSSVEPDGPTLAKDLRRLLALKSNAQYSPMVLAPSTADDATVWAGRLTARMDALIRHR